MDSHPGRPEGWFPKVGVIVPAYNVEPYIQTCLDSISAQTYPNTFAYVVDDLSEDDTWARTSNHMLRQCRALIRNDVHLGWPNTLNRAAWHAFVDDCDAVFVMASDDFLRLDCIAKCVEKLWGHGFVVTYTQQVGEDNVVQVSREDMGFDDFAEWPPMTNQALVTRQAWEAVGGYSEDVRLPGLPNGFMEDWDFWLKIMKTDHRHYAVVTEPTYYVRMHTRQLHKDAGVSGADRQSRVDEFRELMRERHPEMRRAH